MRKILDGTRHGGAGHVLGVHIAPQHSSVEAHGIQAGNGHCVVIEHLAADVSHNAAVDHHNESVDAGNVERPGVDRSKEGRRLAEFAIEALGAELVVPAHGLRKYSNIQVEMLSQLLNGVCRKYAGAVAVGKGLFNHSK